MVDPFEHVEINTTKRRKNEILSFIKSNWKNVCYCNKHIPFMHTHEIILENTTEKKCGIDECSGTISFDSQVIGMPFRRDYYKVVNYFKCDKNDNHFAECEVTKIY